jgi:hypothetical protein
MNGLLLALFHTPQCDLKCGQWCTRFYNVVLFSKTDVHGLLVHILPCSINRRIVLTALLRQNHHNIFRWCRRQNAQNAEVVEY